MKGHLKRSVCRRPLVTDYLPQTNYDLDAPIELTLDEYECIRLIDYEQLTQLECSIQMHISRASVQAIYASARSKLARMLVRGMPLKITVPDYVECASNNSDCMVRKKTKRHCSHCLKASDTNHHTFVLVVSNDQITHLTDPNACFIALTYQNKQCVSQVTLNMITDIDIDELVVSNITNYQRQLLIELGISYRLSHKTYKETKEEIEHEILQNE